MKNSSLYKSLILLWFSHLFMDFFTGIWPIYKTLAQVDISKAGLIAGISGFSGELLQVFFGYLCDRGHRKKILLFGLLLSSSILWITFTAGIFESFFILLILMIGSGSFHPAAAGTASSLSRLKKGRVILFFASGGSVGLAISQLVFTKTLNVFNGHALVLLIPLLLIGLFIAFHKFPTQNFASSEVSLKTFLKPIMHCKKPLSLLYFSQVAVQGFMLAFIFILPDLLQAHACHSWLCLGGGHLCFVLSSALVMVPVGYLCDRFGQKSVMLIVLTGACILLYLFLGQNNLSLGRTILLLSSLGACLGTLNPIIISWGNRLVPDYPSTVSAILMGFAWCLSSLGPAAAGMIAKSFEEDVYINTITLLSLALIGVFFLILMMPKPEIIKVSKTASDLDPIPSPALEPTNSLAPPFEEN